MLFRSGTLSVDSYADELDGLSGTNLSDAGMKLVQGLRDQFGGSIRDEWSNCTEGNILAVGSSAKLQVCYSRFADDYGMSSTQPILVMAPM